MFCVTVKCRRGVGVQPWPGRVLGSRHWVAVQQNIPCPFVDLVFGFRVRRTAQGLKGIFPFARRPDAKIITRLFLCTVGVVPCFALLRMAIKWPDYTLTTFWTTDRTTLLFRRLQFELQIELHFDYIFDAFVKRHVPEQNDLCLAEQKIRKR